MAALNLGGLRSRLLLLVLLAILPGFVLTLLFRIRERDLIAARYREQAARVAQQVVVKQDALVEETRELLQTLATQPELNITECSPTFEPILQKSQQYLVLATISPQGDLVCSVPTSAKMLNVGDRSWFQKTLRNHNFAIGEYQVGRITGQPGIGFSYPILADDRVKTVIVATLSLTWLNEVIAQQNLPAGSTISVIDRQGVVLAHYPKPNLWVGQSIRHTPLFQELQRQNQASNIVETQGLDGSLQLFAFTNLLPQDVSDLEVIISIPQSVILTQVNQDALESFLWLSLITLFALTATWYFSVVAIQRPICELLDVTQKLTKGELTARVERPFQPGILGQLAEAFNEMGSSLETHVAERAEVEKAREVATIKERFVSMVSHEFRTPLSAVLIAARMLKQFGDQMSVMQKNESFDRLFSAVNQMTQLMEDVLLLGQDQAGVALFSPKLMNPAEFCGRLIESMQINASAQHRLLFVNDEKCEQANLDEKLLRSILTNLLSNAIKYSPNGGEVRLVFRHVDYEGEIAG
ncbi:sensor histidine kinase [Leptolyngbya boryana CZ1]|uniref:histidine kinase n=1 Tax=Leptolyngbya boryana CZ1 TaxID=3060204 RepID=A0AA96WWN2_LEPBY|nr:sensor histidine kinase [Leptolyngbya boryana]WNZ46836.1 sensor histidine kinase [Leptolyngbya boryana CZ1]